MEKETYVKILSGAASGAISFLFGSPNVLFYGLIFCVISDYITGICAAVYEKKLNSETGFRGILKKVVILLIVSLSHILGQIVHMLYLRDLVIGFYIANESLSILENAARMDVKCTKKLKQVLEQLKEE